jgi:hypothetical protein
MRPNQALIAANGVAVPQVYTGLLRKNIRKSSAKPNDFVGRNRKLATNSFYVMGEIFLETLMATPAKAVLQLCAAGARTRGAGGTVSDGAEEVAPAIHT